MSAGFAVEERLTDVARRARATLATPEGRLRALTALLSLACVVLPPLVVVLPWLEDTTTYGFHDWDVQTSHRHLVKQALLEHGELPWWNPYACGGFPAWGYVEAATVVVSPLLPAYLLLDMPLALRVEVLAFALTGAVGAFALAGRFARGLGARAVVVALWAVNGRWGLQTASGHTWHLAYALLPWAWLFYERARAREGRLRDVVGLGACFAMLVYAGGIYPLPHAVLLLGVLAASGAALERSLRPLAVLAGGGLVGLGLAAPKLVPMLSVFERAPRLIASTERLSPEAFVTLLTSRAQAFYDRPARVSPYGWHEWGMYVSTPGALLLLAGFVLARGRDAWPLRIAGALFVALGFGAFAPWSPWALLHEHVPAFRSQHVPSRFLYPAALVCAVLAAAALDRWVAALPRWRRAIEPGLAAAALALGLDVAAVAQKPMRDAMWMRPPAVIPRAPSFRTEQKPPVHYVRRDWAGPMYLAMLANTGVLECYGTPPFEGRGAIAARDARYRGEVFVDGGGAVEPLAWSPNGVEVRVRDAAAGARLVLNQNADPGWTARVERGGDVEAAAVSSAGARPSIALPTGDSVVSFRYRPPGLGLGLAWLALTVAGLCALRLRGASAGSTGRTP